jgi:hypothetical protein
LNGASLSTLVGTTLTAAAPAFFIATGGAGAEFSVTASLNRPNFTATGGMGFVSVDVAGGSTQIATPPSST